MRLSCCAGSCVPAGPELGLYLQLLSGACASAMGLAAKVVGGMGVPVFEIVLARSLVVLVVSGAMVASNGGSPAKWPWRSERCVPAATGWRAVLLLHAGGARRAGWGSCSCPAALSVGTLSSGLAEADPQRMSSVPLALSFQL
jgi:hypothetical protein